MKVEITTDGFNLKLDDYNDAEIQDKYKYFRQFKNAINKFADIYNNDQQAYELKQRDEEEKKQEARIKESAERNKKTAAKIKIREDEEKRKQKK